MTVDVSPTRLQAASVSVGEVVGALQAQNLAAPVGRLIGSLRRAHDPPAAGASRAPRSSRQLVVASRGGRLVRLGDVATVHVGTEEPRTAALFNGKEAVGIDIKKSKGYSTTAGRRPRARARSTTIRKTLPPGVDAQHRPRRRARASRNSVANVEGALVEGALLTVLVVFLFLNSWRSTVITGLALPVSVIASFIAVLAFGFTLNTMSLLGLSLAIGILIDDAIVVRENIVRHVEMGKDHYTAAREGTSEIGLAVAATTFSIVVVFVPIAFMGGVAQQWMAPFALTIACSVLVSLFVSFSLDPMLSAYWPDPHLPIDAALRSSRAALGHFNDWFNRQADRYKTRDRLGARHRFAMVAAGGRLVRRRARDAGARVCSAASSSRSRTTRSSSIDDRDAAGIEPRVHDGEGSKKSRRWRGRSRGSPYTYATVGGAIRRRRRGHGLRRADRRRPSAREHQDEIARTLRAALRRRSAA